MKRHRVSLNFYIFLATASVSSGAVGRAASRDICTNREIVSVAPLPKTLSVQGVDSDTRVGSNPMPILESLSHLGGKLKGFVSNSHPI
jgi:hypothetical protein